MALHCPECGFVNAEGANYCQKCGAYLASAAESPSGDRTTITYAVDDQTGELKPVDVEKRVEAALATGGRLVRSKAPHWWTIASPDNHGIDIAAWPDFEDGGE